MADDKGTALAARSRSAPKVVAPRNNVNVALPFSKITAEEPMKLKVGDWISLAGLVISVVGFSVVIWQLIRTAKGDSAYSSGQAREQSSQPISSPQAE